MRRPRCETGGVPVECRLSLSLARLRGCAPRTTSPAPAPARIDAMSCSWSSLSRPASSGARRLGGPARPTALAPAVPRRSLHARARVVVARADAATSTTKAEAPGLRPEPWTGAPSQVQVGITAAAAPSAPGPPQALTRAPDGLGSAQALQQLTERMAGCSYGTPDEDTLKWYLRRAAGEGKWRAQLGLGRAQLGLGRAQLGAAWAMAR
jgi:hypothetical protein